MNKKAGRPQNWQRIPDDRKKQLLSNMWRGKCRHEVAITNFTEAVNEGDLLLVGLCTDGDVARLIEMS